MIEIDGQYGEGGGQILRTALSLSSLLRRPFRIFNVRKGRMKPGLMPQHLACVRALQEITRAAVRGAERGSTQLTFEPSETKPGDYRFQIGTAGSTSLLLQALLPPLLFSKAPSCLSLEGGTHVPFSPPYEYITGVFIPMLERFGFGIAASIERYGFYPKGGGKITVRIRPCSGMQPIDLHERGTVRQLTGLSGVGNLPISIAYRQRDAADKRLANSGLRTAVKVLSVAAEGEGTFLFLRCEAEKGVAGFSALGARGKRAETVGEEAAAQCLEYLSTGACLDPWLADQILLYLAVAKKPVAFSTSRLSGHLVTNLWCIQRFLDFRYRLEGPTGSPGRVIIHGETA